MSCRLAGTGLVQGEPKLGREPGSAVRVVPGVKPVNQPVVHPPTLTVWVTLALAPLAVAVSVTS
jgi:hypothetical protein